MTNNHKNIKLFITLLTCFCVFFSLSFAATCQSMVTQLRNQWRTDREIRQAIEDQWCDADRYLWTNTSTSNSTNSAWTTQQWRDILNQLRREWRTDDEIIKKIDRLWLDSSAYFGGSSSYSSRSTNSAWTTQQWRDVLNQLRREWRTDDEIIKKMNDLWLDASGYFGISSSASDTVWTYTSRSCKTYNIIYNPSLDSYTSPDLKKKEYFISAAYFKRYIDSKNPQVSWCPTNKWWITTTYSDKSSSSERYIAPNGKVYYIVKRYWWYTSDELDTPRTFDTIQNLKYYIRDNNPFINMESRSVLSHWTYRTNTDTSTHWAAEASSGSSDDEEIDYSEEAKQQRDIVRKNDLAQIQSALITSRIENDRKWPGMENNEATEWLIMANIAKDLEKAGLTYVPFDPISSNIVRWLWTIRWIWEYIYIVTKSNWVKNAWVVLMAKPETKQWANRIVCDWEKDFDNGYITNSTDIKDIQFCTSFIKSDYCERDNQGRSNTQKCYYTDDSQLRYILTY